MSPKGLFEGFIVYNFFERYWIAIDDFAEPGDLRRVGRVQSAGDDGGVWRLYVQVIDQACRLFASRPDRGGHAPFIGRFVFREAEIAIDTHDTIFGSDTTQILHGPEADYHLVYKSFVVYSGTLVRGAVFLEPRLIVILLKPLQEIKHKFQVYVIVHADLSSSGVRPYRKLYRDAD